MVRAFIVDMDNVPGSLARIAGAVAEHGVNITGIAAAGSGGSGIVGFMADDEAGARAALQAGSFRSHEVDVVTALLDHRPGSLAAAATRLADAGVNVELVTPMGMSGGKMSVAFGVSDAAAARTALGDLAEG
jgi:hypothetical protein